MADNPDYDAGYSDGYNEGYDEGYDEGYEEGQREATAVTGEVFKAIHKWLEERGVLNWDDHPEGLNTDALMGLIYEHEDNIALAAKQSVMQ